MLQLAKVFSKMIVKPFRQSQVDGLCGLFSIINSINTLYNLSDAEATDLFEFLMKTTLHVAPRGCYRGLFFTELWKIVQITEKHVSKKFPVSFSIPYALERYDNLDGFFNDLAEKFHARSACAIIGFGHPWGHWSVANHVLSKTLSLMDSSGCKRVYRHTLHTNGNTDKGTYLHTRQTILVEKINK